MNIKNIYVDDFFETVAQDDGSILIRPRWISVLQTDRLPENFEEVLFTDSQEVFKGYRLKNCVEDPDEWYGVGDQYIDGVTHWMPLPKAPEL